MPMRPLFAISWPRLSTCVPGALISTLRLGDSGSSSVTLRPAASRIWPFGALIRPLLLMSGAIR